MSHLHAHTRIWLEKPLRHIYKIVCYGFCPENKDKKVRMIFLSKQSGEMSYSPSCCIKNIQPFVIFTLICIEIIETNNNVSQSLCWPKVLNSSQSSPCTVPPERSSITGTIARIKVIYCRESSSCLKWLVWLVICASELKKGAQCSCKLTAAADCSRPQQGGQTW